MKRYHPIIEDAVSQFWHPRRLGHTNLFITSYERAADYYRDVVGFKEAYRQPNNMAAFMSNGNTHHDLGLTDIRSRYCKPGQMPDLWHLAFEVENEVDLVDGYNRAIEAGIAFESTDDHDVAHYRLRRMRRRRDPPPRAPSSEGAWPRQRPGVAPAKPLRGR